MGGTGGGGGGGAVTLVAPTIINQGILTINEKLKVEGGAGIATGAGWSGHVKSGNGGSGVQIIIN
jgi:phage baseplate assembly protein gpV